MRIPLIHRLNPAPSRQPKLVKLPPFACFTGTFDRRDVVDQVHLNARQHPTDIIVDSSVFAPDRIGLARELLVTFPPIVLPSVVTELADIRAKPHLSELAEVVFPGGTINSRFLQPHTEVLHRYRTLASRYINILYWRKLAIDVVAKKREPHPVGRARGRLIEELGRHGVGEETRILANKAHGTRMTDECLAVYAVLSPIITGRDCYLFTADNDVFLQVSKFVEMLFDDYGAYLAAQDLRRHPQRYTHRHTAHTTLFEGNVEAIGRDNHPHYLLPPVKLTKTCATHVIDVARLRRYTWIGARNMEPALDFQNADPMSRKGDVGDGRSLMFSAPIDKDGGRRCMHKGMHMLLGTPVFLKTSDDRLGKIPAFELWRAHSGHGEKRVDRSRIVTPHQDELDRLMQRVNEAFERTSNEDL